MQFSGIWIKVRVICSVPLALLPSTPLWVFQGNFLLGRQLGTLRATASFSRDSPRFSKSPPAAGGHSTSAGHGHGCPAAQEICGGRPVDAMVFFGVLRVPLESQHSEPKRKPDFIFVPWKSTGHLSVFGALAIERKGYPQAIARLENGCSQAIICF